MSIKWIWFLFFFFLSVKWSGGIIEPDSLDVLLGIAVGMATRCSSLLMYVWQVVAEQTRPSVSNQRVDPQQSPRHVEERVGGIVSSLSTNRNRKSHIPPSSLFPDSTQRVSVWPLGPPGLNFRGNCSSLINKKIKPQEQPDLNWAGCWSWGKCIVWRENTPPLKKIIKQSPTPGK